MTLEWDLVHPITGWATEAYRADSNTGAAWRIEYLGPRDPTPGTLSPLSAPGAKIPARVWLLRDEGAIPFLRYNYRVRVYSSLSTAKKAAQRIEDSSMNRLVDYANLPASARGGQNARPTEYLTTLGKRVLERAKEMVGRAPKFIGANAKGIYLKWLLSGEEVKTLWAGSGKTFADGSPFKTRRSSPTAEEDRVLVSRDWLLDEGIEVEVEYLKTKGYKADPTEPNFNPENDLPERLWIKLNLS